MKPIIDTIIVTSDDYYPIEDGISIPATTLRVSFDRKQKATVIVERSFNGTTWELLYQFNAIRRKSFKLDTRQHIRVRVTNFDRQFKLRLDSE